MTPAPDISVITPVHNGTAYIARAIRSVFAQTFTNWEHIVVDDASIDDSFAIARSLSEAEPRLRPFRLQHNRGSSAARNVAIGHARAPLIAYLDSDDEYYSDFLAHAVRLADRADVLVFRYDIVSEIPDHRFGETWSYDPAPEMQRMMEVNPFTPIAAVHKKALYETVGMFNEKLWFEVDWDLWKRLARAGASFHHVARKSGLYHARPTSQARTKRPPDVR